MTKRIFLPGDPVPWFVCRSTNNPAFHFDTAAGRYLVLSFFGSAAIPKNAGILANVCTKLRPFFNDENIAFFGISIDPADESEVRLRQMEPGIRYFWDFDGAVSALYGAVDAEGVSPGGETSYRSFTLVVDPLMRVVANIPMTDAAKHDEILAAVLAAIPAVADLPSHAPILILPNVFERSFCRRLMELYNNQGGSESGFMREQAGNTVGVMDYGFKRRKDFRFDDAAEYDELRAQVRARINRRLIPEVQKAFQFKATRIERYVVSCYEGELGGFFRAHRDNTTKGTAHRMFACTFNLNEEEFEGGDLRFPEFGRKTYRAPTGGVVVFSCSALHEALPVTKGRRYAFLPFLYDDAAAQIRAENQKFLTGEVIDKTAG